MPAQKSSGAKGVQAPGCPAGQNFEKPAGYTVVSAKIQNPFDFLPWVHAKDAAAEEHVTKLLVGQPFRYDTAISKALDLINEQDFLPNTPGVRIKVRVEAVVVHCADKNLNLTYHIYSSAVTPSTAGTPEGQVTQERSPQKTSGLTDDASSMTPFHLTPSLGYDGSDKLYAGGAIQIDLCKTCKFKIQGVAEGQGSQQMMSAHVAIKMSRDFLGPINHFDALVNFNDQSLPTGAGQLSNALGSIQATASTHPFLDGNLSARFGGLVERGDQHALLNLPVAPMALTASAVNAVKLYGGVNSRLPHNVFSGSFGLELGTTDVSSGVQWKKYIGDVRHEYWHNLGDKSAIDVDSRLTFGAIQTSGPIPLAERFFGGTYERQFMPDDSWQIRSLSGVKHRR